ncbi:MAG: hypothetical protein EAX81_04615 [Candidatus Thorarchaeota archaeon]|nr:hypothetical protein [Candidatus Thorarchaeota archaeon]
MQKDMNQRIHSKAIHLLKSNIAQNDFVTRKGVVNQPIPIVGPDEKTVSWYVGITIDSFLVGYLQFDTDLNLMRYSTFQRHPSSTKNCPLAKHWLDPEFIMAFIRDRIEPDDEIVAAFLSYDKHPTRPVWMVRVREIDGSTRTICVAGEYVYDCSNGGDRIIG